MALGDKAGIFEKWTNNFENSQTEENELANSVNSVMQFLHHCFQKIEVVKNIDIFSFYPDHWLFLQGVRGFSVHS